MNKFKVGDKVRIKEDLKAYFNYNGCYFASEMEKYKGKTAVIKFFSIKNGEKNANNYRYELDIDGGMWSWSSSMLEKVEDKKHFKSLPRDFTGTIEIKNGYIVEKEILDKEEKEYLSAVIRPFKKIVKYIRLADWAIIDADTDKYAYIEIGMTDWRSITLPSFKKGTMYKNMKIGKKYTMEELGLD